MKTLSGVLFFLLLAQERGERCEHGTRGASAPVQLDRVEKSYVDFAVRVSKWSGAIDPKLALDQPWDSGLPACTRRQIRRVKRTVPAEMVGKTILFAEEGDGIVFVTKARRRRDLLGKLMATPEAAARFDVRCAPTIVKARKDELELLERP